MTALLVLALLAGACVPAPSVTIDRVEHVDFAAGACRVDRRPRLVSYDPSGAPAELDGAEVLAAVREAVEFYALLRWGAGDVVIVWARPPPGTGYLGWREGDAAHVNPDYPWFVGAGECVDRYDLATVLRHELGHVLGLPHDEDPVSLMFEGVGACEVKHELGCELGKDGR